MDEDFFRDFHLKRQLFDPPMERIAIRGIPIFMIPSSDKKYRSFLDWWFETGRLKPEEPQGWSTVSGPGAGLDRVEAISPEEWEALQKSEQDLILSWVERLPTTFYD